MAKKPTLKELEAKLAEVLKSNEELRAELTVAKQPVIAEANMAAVQAPQRELPKMVEAPKPSQDLNQVPQGFVDVVHNMLNQDFGIEVEHAFDMPGFWFKIIVPKKYSTASEEYFKLYGRDIRPKLIQNADGLDGAKQWVERVWNSFNPDYKSMIVQDRFKNAEHAAINS